MAEETGSSIQGARLVLAVVVLSVLSCVPLGCDVERTPDVRSCFVSADKKTSSESHRALTKPTNSVVDFVLSGGSGYRQDVMLAVCMAESRCIHYKGGSVLKGGRWRKMVGAFQIHPVNFPLCGGRQEVEGLEGNARCAAKILGDLEKKGLSLREALMVYHSGASVLSCRRGRLVAERYAEEVIARMKRGEVDDSD